MDHEWSEAKASFLEAARTGDLQSLRRSFDNYGGRISSVQEYEALQFAAQNGHPEVVDFLLRNCKITDSKDFIGHDWCFDTSKDQGNSSPLHIAVREGHLDVVRKIVTFFHEQQDSHPAKQEKAKKWFQGLVEWAVRWGHASIVELLLSHPLMQIPLSEILLPLVHLAAYNNGNDQDHLDVLQTLLQQYKTHMPAESPLVHQNGLTALHLAAQSGYLSAVKLLASIAGVNMNEKSYPELVTPLHMAAHFGHSEVVGFLLDSSLQPAGSQSRFTDPMARDSMGRMPLHYAAQEGHETVVKQLLDFQGSMQHGNVIALIADYDGLLPLHLAARNGHAKVIRLLGSQGGMDCKAKHSFTMRNFVQNEYMGRGIFHERKPYSCFGKTWRFPFPKLINSLFWRTEGFTPLHLAARYGQKAAIQELLKQRNSSNIDVLDEDKRDPLFMKDGGGFLAYDWMKVQKQEKVFQSCISAAGDINCKLRIVERLEQLSFYRTSKIRTGKSSKIASEVSEEEEALEELQHAWERGKYPRPPIRRAVLRWLEDKELGFGRMYWLHWAVQDTGDNMDLLQSLLELEDFDVNEKDADGNSALEFALHPKRAFQRSVIKAFVLHPRIKHDVFSSLIVRALRARNSEDLELAREIMIYCAPTSILDHQVGEEVKQIMEKWENWLVRRERVQLERFLVALVARGNVECASELLRLLLPWAKKKELGRLVKVILDNPELKRGLYEDRQVYLDCANAILVGAALIAGLAFQGWLQPPLGYSWEGYAAVNVRAVRSFWWFNNGAFFLAVGTLIAGAKGAVPVAEETDIVKSVEKVKVAVAVASVLLGMALVCVVGAFTAAGWAVLPPRSHQLGIMLVGVAPHLLSRCSGSLSVFGPSFSTWPSRRFVHSVPRDVPRKKSVTKHVASKGMPWESPLLRPRDWPLWVSCNPTRSFSMVFAFYLTKNKN